MIKPHTPKSAQGIFLIPMVGLCIAPACSSKESIPRCMQMPNNTPTKPIARITKQPVLKQNAGKCFGLQQFPPYVFGCYVIPCLRGREIHHLILTAKKLRSALWEELPFLFKEKQRKQQLEYYLANPECLTPIATVSLKQYVLANYPLAINTGSISLPSTPDKKVKMVDLLAIKSDLFIHFLNKFTPTHRNGALRLFSSKRHHYVSPGLLMYSKARLLTSVYNYLSLPTIIKALRIPEHDQARDDAQRAICAHFAALTSPQVTYTDDGHSQSAQPLFQVILAAKGDSWVSKLNLVTMKPEYHSFFLNYEATCGYTEVSKRLIRFGIDANIKGPNGQTPLHFAARSGNLNVIKFLLANHACIDPLDSNQRTPLTWAARYGHSNVAHILLARGAEVDHVDKKKRTPLHYASEYNQLEVARLLLKKGADVHKRDICGASVLHAVVRGSTLNFGNLLVKRGINVNAKDCINPMVLRQAADYARRKKMISLLVNNNADVNTHNACGHTPLIRALYCDSNLGIAELLVNNGADVNTPIPTGETLLQWAKHNLTIIQRLILYNTMGLPPCDNEQTKYLHSLAKMNGITLPSLPPLASTPHYATVPSCATDPPKAFCMLSQRSYAKIKQAFSDEVLAHIKRAHFHQQALMMLERASAVQNQSKVH